MDPHKRHALSHVDTGGKVRMVDVAAKPVTERTAVASANITMKPDVLDQLLSGRLAKGEALATAKIAAIQAAKTTSSLIPLCHNLALEWVDVTFDTAGEGALVIHVTARAVARTGVEMEALTGAGVAALAIYDMAKAADPAMVIGPIRLESKTGGQSGDYRRHPEN